MEGGNSMAIRKTGSWWAVGEDGRGASIVEYTEYTSASTRDSQSRQELEGRKQYITSDGRPLNRVGKGEYRIVQTGEILRSDDAP